MKHTSLLGTRPLNVPESVYSESNPCEIGLSHSDLRNQAIMQDLGVQNDSHRLVTQLGMDVDLRV